MQSIRIVKALDPIDEIKSRLRAGRIPHPIDPLHLQRLTKLSIGDLSQQFPLRLIDCTMR